MVWLLLLRCETIECFILVEILLAPDLQSKWLLALKIVADLTTFALDWASLAGYMWRFSKISNCVIVSAQLLIHTLQVGCPAYSQSFEIRSRAGSVQERRCIPLFFFKQ